MQRGLKELMLNCCAVFIKAVSMQRGLKVNKIYTLEQTFIPVSMQRGLKDLREALDGLSFNDIGLNAKRIEREERWMSGGWLRACLNAKRIERAIAGSDPGARAISLNAKRIESRRFYGYSTTYCCVSMQRGLKVATPICSHLTAVSGLNAKRIESFQQFL